VRAASIESVQRRVVACALCPELRSYCAEIGRTKKREHRDATYWARPVPSFGDPKARVLLVGLAPGAHGSNRTGRPFTGDASGTWLFRALHRAGFANQSEARDREDGMRLHDVWITAALRCAPPQNKPTPEQLRRCAPHLADELDGLPNLRVIVGLGSIGTKAAVATLAAAGYTFAPKPIFAHGAESIASRKQGAAPIVLIASYHPSRQNTNTKVLTEPMFDAIFSRARKILELGR